MKLLTPAIAVIFLALILGASPLGYCYTNTMAQKTTDDLSEYESMIKIGLSPGTQISLAGATILGSGVVAGVGTYLVVSASGIAATAAASSTTTVATATVATQTLVTMESLVPAVGEALYLPIGGATVEYVEAAALAATDVVGTEVAGTTVMAPYLAPLVIAIGITVVVILVTAGIIFICWSAS